MPKTAPAIVIDYWIMPKDMTLKDVVTIIRVDEAHHRDVNHFAYPWETYQVDLSVDLRKHYVPKKFFDKVAYWLVKLLRIPTNLFFKERYSCRAIILKTVAGVPGMVGGVYERITMFCDVEKALKEIESHFDGTTLNLHGSIKIFYKIEKMLQEEITQFETDSKTETESETETVGSSHLIDIPRPTTGPQTRMVEPSSSRSSHPIYPHLAGEFPSLSSLGANFYSQLKDLELNSQLNTGLTESDTDHITQKSLNRLLESLLRLGLNHLNTIRTKLITGSDWKRILRGITTEVDLNVIIDEYQKRDSISIDRSIDKDTRGDYEIFDIKLVFFTVKVFHSKISSLDFINSLLSMRISLLELLLPLVSSYRYGGDEVDLCLAKEKTKILYEKISNNAYYDNEVIRVLATRRKMQLNATLNYYKDKHDDDNLKIIVDEYQKRDSISLGRAIDKDTRGDYESMLLDLLGQEED
ncbi:Ubiquinol oxidase 2, mitochondrial [Capsicum baccatum]|uniref:Ubiquinol oxidase n=1 Tax=Capsicum baccatum TaxID=33114 RepID=A0A2G2WE39_CAPBA|nr:Ubiquinol oxidase 2, mitochondrial [Capsicum baccatum]